MTWQVSPEEWLLDFTTLPRGRVRAGESLDAIDDRLRQMIAAPPPALIMPVIAARAPKPPPAPPPRVPEPPAVKVPEPPTIRASEPPASRPQDNFAAEANAIIPVLEARPEPRPAPPSQPTLQSPGRGVSEPRPAPPQPPQRSVSGEIGASSPSRSVSGEIGASTPSRSVSGEIGASSPSRSVSGEIGLVMPTLATRPAPAAAPAPAPATEPPQAAEPPAEPRSALDVQLVQTPSAGTGPGGAPVVIPALTRTGFHIDVDDDEASALDRLNPVGDHVGVPSDDADGEDFMSAVAAAAPLMPTSPSPGDSLNEVHADEVIDELDPESILPEFSNPSISIAALSAQLAERAAEKPAAPVEKAPEKPPSERVTLPPPHPDKPTAAPPPVAERTTIPPPPPAERTTIPPPPPSERTTIPPPPPAERTTIPPPPPAEKAADKPPRPPATPPAPTKPPPAAVTMPPPAGNQPSRKRGWYDDAFAEHYGNITPNDADAAAELDAAFIRKAAELGAGQSVLDVGCGDGRHCFALANLGLLVTGLESSLPQLVRAAQRNEATEAGITLLQGDMRSLPRDRTYDAVTCLGSTLGYFESEEQNKQCLQEMVDVLRPGGKLVLHMVNRDNLVAVLPCRSWWQGRGCLVLDVADMNYFTNRMRVHRTVVFEDGRQFEHQMFIRLYSLHELGRLLTGMGMRVVEVSGSRDTRGRFYGATSAEIWLVAQRREDV